MFKQISEYVKTHPYESAALATVGIVGLYLILHRSGGTSSPAAQSNSPGADYYSSQLQLDQLNAQSGAQAAALQADVQKTSIAASVANNQTQAQLQAVQLQDTAAIQAAKIAAGVTDNQTSAQVAVANIQGDVQNTSTAAQVAENENNLAAITGLVSSQNAVQIAQINAGVTEKANNDQTAIDLSGQQYDYQSHIADLQTGIDTIALHDTTQLETQAQSNQYDLAQKIIPMAGQKKNSALDATDQTGLFQTILSGGNAGVASYGTAASLGAAQAGDAESASKFAAGAGVVSTIGKAAMSALFL